MNCPLLWTHSQRGRGGRLGCAFPASVQGRLGEGPGGRAPWQSRQRRQVVEPPGIPPGSIACEAIVLVTEPRPLEIGGERRVTLPLKPACKAGASLFCHVPKRGLAAAADEGSGGQPFLPLQRTCHLVPSFEVTRRHFSAVFGRLSVATRLLREGR